MLARERDWLVPSFLLTLGLGLAASPLWPKPIAGWPDLFFPLYSWAGWGVVAFFIWFVARFLTHARARHPAPSKALAGDVKTLSPRLPPLLLGAGLAAIDLYFFMWMKPQLAEMRPFWGDPWLAAADRALFLGHDPWTLLTFLQNDAVATIYTPFWFLSVMTVICWLLLRPTGVERSRLIVTYFLLWSLFGPIGQALMPAGGPIFYDRIVGGERFAELIPNIPPVAQSIGNYLWAAYSKHELVYGAGISAMPSLHVATVSWEVLVAVLLARRALPYAILFALFILFGSVALGWHYVLDGVAGALGALACYGLSRLIVRSPAVQGEPVRNIA